MRPKTPYTYAVVPYELAVTGERAPFYLWLSIETAPGTHVRQTLPDPHFKLEAEAVEAGHQQARRLIDSNREWKDVWGEYRRNS